MGTRKPEKDADGYFRRSIELPRGVDGKRRRKDIASKTLGGLVAKERAVRKQLAVEGDMRTNSPTVAAWLDYWLNDVKKQGLKPRTWVEYRRKANLYIVPSIGRYRLDALTPAHIRGLHEYIQNSLGLSPTTALQAHRIIAKALEDATREGLVFRNVAKLLDAPKKDAKAVESLSAADAAHLLASVAHDRDLALRIGIALLAGLRQGEALGLHWRDVDLERGVITVQWQLQRLPSGIEPPRGHESKQLRGGLWLLRPKSRAGWRTVPIADELRPYLIPKAGAGPLVFEGLDPRRDARRWELALEAAGLPHVGLHSARHSCSTLMAELGVPEHTRMAIMGHSSATVNRIYTHVSDAEKSTAISGLGRLLLGQGHRA